MIVAGQVNVKERLLAAKHLIPLDPFLLHYGEYWTKLSGFPPIYSYIYSVEDFPHTNILPESSPSITWYPFSLEAK